MMREPLAPQTGALVTGKRYPQFRSLLGQEKYLEAYHQALAELWPVPYEEQDIPTSYGSVHILIFTHKGSYGHPILSLLRLLGMRYGKSSMMKVFPRMFSDQEMMSFSVPTLLLVGRQEMIYDPGKSVSRATKLIPSCQGEIVDGCGHSIYTDQPELLVRMMKDFFGK